jgi:hypothetical protein
MARICNLQPHFGRSPSMTRISRNARLLFVLLWTVVDDQGRCHAFPDDLASVLYPKDFDAPRYLDGWLGELEAEGCIERYEVDDIDYLRVVHWHKHQWIGHPSPSYLRSSPHERPRDSRKVRERSRNLRDRTPNQLDANELSAIREKLAEIAQGEKSGEVTSGKVIETVDVILEASAMGGQLATALRAAELKGRSIGLWAAKRAGRKAAPQVVESQTADPPLSELYGMRKGQGAGT